MEEGITRAERIERVHETAKRINREIPILKYKRSEIIREEIVDAYTALQPSSVMVKMDIKQDDGTIKEVIAAKQVNVGDKVVIHADGSETVYTSVEFERNFAQYVEEPKEESEPTAKEE